MPKNIKIVVVGTGYVGMSMCVLLSQYNEVIALDVDKIRVDLINNNKSTIADKFIEEYLKNKRLNLSATLDKNLAYKNADFIIVATPTDYNPETNYFNTSSVDKVSEEASQINPEALIIIKSTIPVGHTHSLCSKLKTNKIVFFPEFLREGNALYDNLYPSRIIAGSNCPQSKNFSKLLQKAALKKDIDVIEVDSNEAEAIKLFANTYLAMRVAFFNELDNYAISNKLNTENIIDGVSLDPRIGAHYNNPSFGYGGYCLPKDTKQLLANYENIPQSLISAVVESNAKRKDFITKKILSKKPKNVGFYRLIAKQGSDNFRYSSIQGIIRRISEAGINIILYEPSHNDSSFNGYDNYSCIKQFKKESDLIVTNRHDNELNDVAEKVFTRDLYGND
jgi:UDPglucose 6-dehydrogenase